MPESRRPSNKEGQEDQLGALGLVVNAIVLWNTRYMDAVLSKLQADGDAIADAHARRLSPLVHKHLNFLGRYHFSLGMEWLSASAVRVIHRTL